MVIIYYTGLHPHTNTSVLTLSGLDGSCRPLLGYLQLASSTIPALIPTVCSWRGWYIARAIAIGIVHGIRPLCYAGNAFLNGILTKGHTLNTLLVVFCCVCVVCARVHVCVFGWVGRILRWLPLLRPIVWCLSVGPCCVSYSRAGMQEEVIDMRTTFTSLQPRRGGLKKTLIDLQQIFIPDSCSYCFPFHSLLI